MEICYTLISYWCNVLASEFVANGSMIRNDKGYRAVSASGKSYGQKAAEMIHR